jgi:hypothetical protein
MKQKNILLILIPTFVLTILWLIFSIYHNHVTSTIEDPLTIQIIPIKGTFDNEAIANIKGRNRVNPIYDVLVQEISPTPDPDSEEINPEEINVENVNEGEVIPDESNVERENILPEPTEAEIQNTDEANNEDVNLNLDNE